MAEYIEREALLRKAWDADTRIGYVQVVDVGDILDMPAADVAPVIHGRWTITEEYNDVIDMTVVKYTCSACNEDFYIEPTGDTAKDLFTYTYCPSCGAKMDGGEESG